LPAHHALSRPVSPGISLCLYLYGVRWQLFEFGDRYRGTYDSSIAEARSYYASVSGYRDELLWAALWLHRATGRAEYLRYAADRADDFGGVGWAMTEFSWDVKYAGVQVLAAKVRATDSSLRSRAGC